MLMHASGVPNTFRNRSLLSNTEIRHIIESGFAPLSCRCELTSNEALTVEIYEADTGKVELFVTGIALSDVQTSRAVARLICELRSEVAFTRLEGPHRRQQRSA